MMDLVDQPIKEFRFYLDIRIVLKIILNFEHEY